MPKGKKEETIAEERTRHWDDLGRVVMQLEDAKKEIERLTRVAEFNKAEAERYRKMMLSRADKLNKLKAQLDKWRW